MLTYSEDTLSDRDFQLVSDMVYRHCGINLHDGKKELVRARLAKRIRLAGFPNVSQYLAFVQEESTGNEFAHLIDAISTNLTSFFREQSHFDFLNEQFLPALLEKKRKRGDLRIRAWSAACSSGEEPYSLAFTLLEAVENPAAWDLKLLATDISRPVLETARRGIYDKARTAAVPPALRSRYFNSCTVDGDKSALQVVDAARGLVRFNHLNLMEPWPFTGPFDFIFCRNVMIYFDKPTQEKLVNRFWDMLAEGGLLFTGHSESLTGVSHKFKYVRPTIYGK